MEVGFLLSLKYISNLWWERREGRRKGYSIISEVREHVERRLLGLFWNAYCYESIPVWTEDTGSGSGLTSKAPEVFRCIMAFSSALYPQFIACFTILFTLPLSSAAFLKPFSLWIHCPHVPLPFDLYLLAVKYMWSMFPNFLPIHCPWLQFYVREVPWERLCSTHKESKFSTRSQTSWEAPWPGHIKRVDHTKPTQFLLATSQNLFPKKWLSGNSVFLSKPPNTPKLLPSAPPM